MLAELSFAIYEERSLRSLELEEKSLLCSSICELEEEVFVTKAYGPSIVDGFFETGNKHVQKFLVLAYAGKKVLAYAYLEGIFPILELQRLASAKAFRRKGLATKMLGLLLRELRELAYEKIELECQDSNTIARLFYEKLGFVEVAKRPNYYGLGSSAILYDLWL